MCESPLLNASATTDVLFEILPMHDDRSAEDADAWHDPLLLEVVYTPLLPDPLTFVGGGSDILLAATGHPYLPIYHQALSHFIALPYGNAFLARCYVPLGVGIPGEDGTAVRTHARRLASYGSKHEGSGLYDLSLLLVAELVEVPVA